jgi:hypothetical protein
MATSGKKINIRTLPTQITKAKITSRQGPGLAGGVGAVLLFGNTGGSRAAGIEVVEGSFVITAIAV